MCLWLCERAWIKDHDGESGSDGLNVWRALSCFIFYLFNCFCERGRCIFILCGIVGLHYKYFIGRVKYHIAVI